MKKQGDGKPVKPANTPDEAKRFGTKKAKPELNTDPHRDLPKPKEKRLKGA